MFNGISNKSNMRQYFCQCFDLLPVNDLKLISLPPLRRKKAVRRSCTIFFHSFSLLFVKLDNRRPAVFWENVFHQVGFIVRIPKVTLK